MRVGSHLTRRCRTDSRGDRSNVTRAKAAFGFEATTNLRDGLRRTIEWYERHVDVASSVPISRDNGVARPSLVRHELEPPPLAS